MQQAGLFSGLCGWFGMKMATNASARTTHAAKQSLNAGLTVAFREAIGRFTEVDGVPADHVEAVAGPHGTVWLPEEVRKNVRANRFENV